MKEYNPVISNVEKELALNASELVERAFGIDIEEFIRLHEESDKRCPICVREKDINYMVIDLFPPFEDKKIRGIICVDCKKMVNATKEDWATIQRLVPYMKGDFKV